MRGLEAATPDELASAAFLHRSSCATGRPSQNCSWISHYGRRTFRVIEPPDSYENAEEEKRAVIGLELLWAVCGYLRCECEAPKATYGGASLPLLHCRPATAQPATPD